MNIQDTNNYDILMSAKNSFREVYYGGMSNLTHEEYLDLQHHLRIQIRDIKVREVFDLAEGGN